jgi:hypothetical protein
MAGASPPSEPEKPDTPAGQRGYTLTITANPP